jgi:hypothetical protein
MLFWAAQAIWCPSAFSDFTLSLANFCPYYLFPCNPCAYLRGFTASPSQRLLVLTTFEFEDVCGGYQLLAIGSSARKGGNN